MWYITKIELALIIWVMSFDWLKLKKSSSKLHIIEILWGELWPVDPPPPPPKKKKKTKKRCIHDVIRHLDGKEVNVKVIL